MGPGAEQLGGGEAVDPGHPDVHEHHVGPVPVGRREHLGAIGRLSHHVDAGGTAEDHHYRCPYQGIVVDNENAD